jgi:hypothetical protein
VREVYNRAGDPKKMVVLNCRHTDLLAGEPCVTQAITEAAAWFKQYLAPLSKTSLSLTSATRKTTWHHSRRLNRTK